MGFLFYHGSSYHYQFKNDAGKWVRKTTKKKTQAEAELWVQEFLHKKNSPQIPVIAQATIPNTPTYTFQDLLQRIKRHCEVNHCPNTANIVFNVMHEFGHIVGNYKDLNDITFEDIEEHKKRRQQKVELATVNRDLRNLKTIFNLAIKWKMIKENPAQYSKKFRVEQKEIHTFETEEILKLLQSMYDKNYHHLVNITLFGLYTGMRLNEIINLQWNDIDLDKRIITVRNKANFKTKTGKIRLIPISDKLLEVIQKIIPKIYNPEALLFGNTWNRVYTKTYISRKFKYFIKLSGIRIELHFHCLRHTFITNLLKNNVSIVKVQKLAGHTNIKTTLIYTHLNVEDLREAINCI